MDMNKIDTVGFANKVKEEIRADVDTLAFTPEYTCYIVSDENGEFDKASERYVSLKHKTSEECNVKCVVKKMTPKDFCKEMLRITLEEEEPVRAMLQLPAPKACVECFENAVAEGHIIDVDHLGDDVLTDMWNGKFDRIPGTPRGVVALLCEELGSLSGKKIAVVGSRSKTTGRFLIPMLQHLNATVLMYHSRSEIKLGEFADCDAIVSCVGKAHMINNSHILGDKNIVCIDVGVSFKDGKVVGDFAPDIRHTKRYTPYVNGMGLLTRVFLVRNVVDNYLVK